MLWFRSNVISKTQNCRDQYMGPVRQGAVGVSTEPGVNP